MSRRKAGEDILRGVYHLDRFGTGTGPRVTLLGSGAIPTEVIKAARQLADRGKLVDVISVTSWSELAPDASANGEGHRRQPLQATDVPVVADSDYVRALSESVRVCLPPGRVYRILGTDGFGRSDTRAALRAFFGVDAAAIMAATKECGV